MSGVSEVVVITSGSEQYHITDLTARCLFVVCLIGSDWFQFGSGD
jgi:hypothetical protein